MRSGGGLPESNQIKVKQGSFRTGAGAKIEDEDEAEQTWMKRRLR